jgi:hypothetical protein
MKIIDLTENSGLFSSTSFALIFISPSNFDENFLKFKFIKKYFVAEAPTKQATAFVPEKYFQSSLIFVGKAKRRLYAPLLKLVSILLG